jgi:hypothetical protein
VPSLPHTRVLACCHHVSDVLSRFISLTAFKYTPACLLLSLQHRGHLDHRWCSLLVSEIPSLSLWQRHRPLQHSSCTFSIAGAQLRSPEEPLVSIYRRDCAIALRVSSAQLLPPKHPLFTFDHCHNNTPSQHLSSSFNSTISITGALTASERTIGLLSINTVAVTPHSATLDLTYGLQSILLFGSIIAATRRPPSAPTASKNSWTLLYYRSSNCASLSVS